MQMPAALKKSRHFAFKYFKKKQQLAKFIFLKHFVAEPCIF
jgi:hypothetical protein